MLYNGNPCRTAEENFRPCNCNCGTGGRYRSLGSCFKRINFFCNHRKYLNIDPDHNLLPCWCFSPFNCFKGYSQNGSPEKPVKNIFLNKEYQTYQVNFSYTDLRMQYWKELPDLTYMNISCSIEPSQDKKKRGRNALVVLVVGVLLLYFGSRIKRKNDDD